MKTKIDINNLYRSVRHSLTEDDYLELSIIIDSEEKLEFKAGIVSKGYSGIVRAKNPETFLAKVQSCLIPEEIISNDNSSLILTVKEDERS